MFQAWFNSGGGTPRAALLAAAMASLVLHGCVARPEPGRAGENVVRPRVEEAASWPSRHIAVRVLRHAGRSAVRIVGTAGDDVVDKLVVLPVRLGNGTVELEMTGSPEPGQPPGARAYFGVAFRGDEDLSRFEALYVRPENSRSDDPVRRNRSAQYIMFPDRPWDRLRREAPGRYESYVDLTPGAWTRVRVVLRGNEARLYVNDAVEPALVVTDLVSDGATPGRVALWIGNRTIAYFTAIRAIPAAR